MILIIFIDSNLCLSYIYKPYPQPRRVKPPSFPVSLPIIWTSYYLWEEKSLVERIAGVLKVLVFHYFS